MKAVLKTNFFQNLFHSSTRSLCLHSNSTLTQLTSKFTKNLPLIRKGKALDPASQSFASTYVYRLQLQIMIWPFKNKIQLRFKTHPSAPSVSFWGFLTVSLCSFPINHRVDLYKWQRNNKNFTVSNCWSRRKRRICILFPVTWWSSWLRISFSLFHRLISRLVCLWRVQGLSTGRGNVSF